MTAEQGGFSLHAATHVHADDTRGREAICRYILRPPLANDRLSTLPDGRVRIRLKKPFRDGTTAVELAPLAFMARLGAIVPFPRLHIVRYHGLLAPRSRHRAQVVPARRADDADASRAGDNAVDPGGPTAAVAAAPPPLAAQSPDNDRAALTHPDPRRRYIPWAELLKRTFRTDVLHCDQCGGRMKLVALVTQPASIARFLAGVGLPTGPPESPPDLRAPPPPSPGAPHEDSFPHDPASAPLTPAIGHLRAPMAPSPAEGGSGEPRRPRTTW